MKRTSLSEYSVEEILTHYNLIVPEIQREYVWGLNTHQIIDVFLDDIVEGRKSKNSDSESKLESLKKILEDPNVPAEAKEALHLAINQIQDVSIDINIGFLYSYRPGYSDASKDKDLYLIDGQQRFTTLFLLLFYFGIKENRLHDFYNLFKINLTKGTLGFDYRVRSLTHQFFLELFKNIDTLDELLTIRGQNWFLKSFSRDSTVNAICGVESDEFSRASVFELFHQHFLNDSQFYFDYIKSKIKFWHFKTEETSQGEELYITMNSRGQQLADNETIRAKLFDTDEVKNNALYWSEKWELWQDFFWKNRNKSKGHSADEGFNEFLRWVCVLKFIKTNFNIESSLLRQSNELATLLDTNEIIIDYLTLYDIEKYFNVIYFLFEPFSHYIESDVNLRYSLSGLDFTKYFSKNNFIGEQSKTILSQSDLFKLLPIISYVSRFEKIADIDNHQLFRLVKFINNVSEDENVGKAIRVQLINILKIVEQFDLSSNIWEINRKDSDKYETIFNEEQTYKLDYFEKVSDLIKCESLFWKAEELKYNNGKILHLIGLAENIVSDSYNLSSFETVLNTYIEFLENEDLVWGIFIETNIYQHFGYRIQYSKSFNEHPSFLAYLYGRIQIPEPSINDYLIFLQKKFILDNYLEYDHFINEKDAKKQLYVYYILKFNQLVDNVAKWNWDDGRYNFGVWDKGAVENCSSIFSTELIFQFINKKFVSNATFVLDAHYRDFEPKKVHKILVGWAQN